APCPNEVRDVRRVESETTRSHNRKGRQLRIVLIAAMVVIAGAGSVEAKAKIVPGNWKPCANAVNGVVYEHATNFRGDPITITRLQPPAWTRSRAIKTCIIDFVGGQSEDPTPDE